jgi:hypothetical protein
MSAYQVSISTSGLASQPFGLQFLLWSARLSVAQARGVDGAEALCVRGFAKIGWPEGRGALAALLGALDAAWPARFMVRPPACRCMTRDEASLARVAALVALRIPELAQDELETVTDPAHADNVLARLDAVVSGLRDAGLPLEPALL